MELPLTIMPIVLQDELQGFVRGYRERKRRKLSKNPSNDDSRNWLGEFNVLVGRGK